MGRSKEERSGRKKDFRESRLERKDKRYTRDQRDSRERNKRRNRDEHERPEALGEVSWHWHNWDHDREIERSKTLHSQQPDRSLATHRDRDHTPTTRKHDKSPTRGRGRSTLPSRKPEKPSRDEKPLQPKNSPFVVSREDGSTYEIERTTLKHTQALPSLAYSYATTNRTILAENPTTTQTPPLEEETGTETPEKLLESLRSKLDKGEERNSIRIETPVIGEKRELSVETVLKPEKPKITFKLNILPEDKAPIKSAPETAIQPVKESPKDEFIYDIFGAAPVVAKAEVKVEDSKISVKPKDEVKNSSLRQISMLYDDDDDEEDAFMPTNAIRIGSNQIRLPAAKVFKEKKAEVKVESNSEPAAPPSSTTPFVEEPTHPVEIQKEGVEAADRPVSSPVKFKVESVEKPSVPLVIKPLDILRELDNETTEVDDFLQQIQMQRQRIEEKITPRKPAKFIIDIDSFQQEINEKLKQMHDFGPASASNPNRRSSSSSPKSSSNQLTSEEDSSDSSASSSEESTSSSSSSSATSSTDEDSEEEERVDKTEEISTPRQQFTPFSLDLSSLARSPVTLKIPSKPKVTPLIALAGDEEEHVERPAIQEVKKALEDRPPKDKDRSGRRREESKRRKEVDRRDAKRESKSSRSYNRDRDNVSIKESSHRSRPSRRRSSCDRNDSHHKDKDRKSTRSSRKVSRGIKPDERESHRRSRGSSHSPPSSRQRKIDRMSSRSRSPSEERRKRSPWRPPIDFWENLNVPPTSWAYNVDEQYFSRAYYDESYNYFDQHHYNGPNYDDPSMGWNVPLPEMINGVPASGGGGGGTSPTRGSLDDRINSVLNDMSYPGPINAPQGSQQMQSDASYTQCYGNEMYNDYHHRPDQQHPEPLYNNQHYRNQSGSSQVNQMGGQLYRQSANLRSINCDAFALQKGKVIEFLPKESDNNLPSSGYQSEDVLGSSSPRQGEEDYGATRRSGIKHKQGSSEERKSVREKKRLDKKMRKMKLEMELLELLEGRPTTIDINIDGERRQSPTKEEVRKVIFSDGVLPGDGTSDSIIDSSDDLANIDISELSANQLKKYRKRKRKKKTAVKADLFKSPELAKSETTNGELADATVNEESSNLPVFPPAPPPSEPPMHLQQPILKREVMERPKKLLYFNTLHRERRMDFFSIFVPPAMFIRLNDPRLVRGHPAIMNRRRIPQPIYPPNVYPPPPQPFQHLPPVQISGQANMAMGSGNGSSPITPTCL